MRAELACAYVCTYVGVCVCVLISLADKIKNNVYEEYVSINVLAGIY